MAEPIQIQKRLLSIIIPEYKPDLERYVNNLNSIAAQLNVDFNQFYVIIVNDCDGQPLAEQFYQQFPRLSFLLFNRPENGGPGLARQSGIDIAPSEYVMFMDADDRLYSPMILSQLLHEMGHQLSVPVENKWDVLLTNWLEEALTPESKKDGVILPNRYGYVPHNNDGTWMHGKVYRRQFLIDENIRFNELRVHEDRRVNMIAFALGRTAVLNTKEYSYLWTYNPNSIVRRDNAAYSYNSMDVAIDAANQAYSELLTDHGERCNISTFDGNLLAKNRRYNPVREICQNVYYMYFMDQAWTGKVDQKYMDSLEEHLAEFYQRFKPFYELFQGMDMYRAYSAEREITMNQSGGFMEKESLDNFLKRVCEKYPYSGRVFEITDAMKEPLK